MRFSRQEYWSGLPCPPPGDLSDPGIKPESRALQAHSLQLEPMRKPYDPVISLLGIYPREMKIYVSKNLYTNVQSSIFLTSQKAETIETSIN